MVTWPGLLLDIVSGILGRNSDFQNAAETHFLPKTDFPSRKQISSLDRRKDRTVRERRILMVIYAGVIALNARKDSMK